MKGWKSRVRVLSNQILNPMGFELKRFRHESDSYMVSSKMRERQIARLAPRLCDISAFFGQETSVGKVEAAITEYYDLILATPVRQSYGGCGFNAGLILYLSGRALDPDLVIESGTFRGFTSWILRNACRDAELHCFDLDLSELAWRDSSILYHEHDWTACDSSIHGLGRSALCFFDDHVSQIQRVAEAKARGFRWLLFDDNLAADSLYADVTPAMPTIDMALDCALDEDETIRWVSRGKLRRYKHDGKSSLEARTIINRVMRAPSLHEETRYSPANITLVEVDQPESN